MSVIVQSYTMSCGNFQTDKLLAHVPFADDVIDIPELHVPILLWKVQIFAMLVHDWKIVHLQVVPRFILDIL